MNPFWRSYFSDGLVQPPTRYIFPTNTPVIFLVYIWGWLFEGFSPWIFPLKVNNWSYKFSPNFANSVAEELTFFIAKNFAPLAGISIQRKKQKTLRKNVKKTWNDPSQELHVFFNHIFHVFLFFKMLTHFFFKVGIPVKKQERTSWPPFRDVDHPGEINRVVGGAFRIHW